MVRLIKVYLFKSMQRMLTAPENQDKTIEELAGETSIYWMYDNITENEQTMMITDKLLDEYKNRKSIIPRNR